jgi:D-threo-aldose 1-dehydrogenase
VTALLPDAHGFGLGCAQLGDRFTALDDAAAAAIVDAAWGNGVRYFDTAPHYGLGLSERRLGAALRCRPRDEYVISTKVGRLLRADADGNVHRMWDFSREGVLASLRESLDRMGLDRADIVLLHDPHESGQLDLAMGEGLQTLLQLRQQGIIRAAGVGSADVPSLARFASERPIDVILLAGRYTLLDQRAAESLLGICEGNGISVLNAGVYNMGSWRRTSPRAGSISSTAKRTRRSSSVPARSRWSVASSESGCRPPPCGSRSPAPQCGQSSWARTRRPRSRRPRTCSGPRFPTSCGPSSGDEGLSGSDRPMLR